MPRWEVERNRSPKRSQYVHEFVCSICKRVFTCKLTQHGVKVRHLNGKPACGRCCRVAKKKERRRQ